MERKTGTSVGCASSALFDGVLVKLASQNAIGSDL
jgi:hypothetical protein